MYMTPAIKNDTTSCLPQVIQLIEQYSNQKDENTRSKSITLLSDITNECIHHFDNDTVSRLIKLYCSRLSDQSIVPELLPGLVSLTGQSNYLNPSYTGQIGESIMQLNVQSFPHITRNLIYSVYFNILNYHSNDIKPISDRFIQGYIKSIYNEKDPRNLMIIYNTIQKMIENMDISHHVEELFDATSCYFPITFRSPPNNPYGLTVKDLKSSLRACMASTPLFAKKAIPLLLQKISTTSGYAKKDCLETLTACASIYDAKELIPYGAKLLNSIKSEIINNDTESLLRDPALAAITALISALSQEKTTIQKQLKTLIDDCIGLLEELEEHTVKPGSLLLRAIGSASPYAYQWIDSTFMPILSRQYRENDEPNKRYLILCSIIAIIQARKMVYGAENSSQTEMNLSDSLLYSYKNRLVEIFETAIHSSNDHPEIRLMGILGLGLMCVLKQYMTVNERFRSIHELNNILECEEDDKLRMSVEMSLLEITQFDPESINKVTVPALIRILSDTSGDNTTRDGAVNYRFTLRSLKTICTSSEVYRVVEPALLNKFIHICDYNKDKIYAREVISTLLDIIKTRQDQGCNDIGESVHTIIPRILNLIIVKSLIKDTENTILLSTDTLHILYQIVSIIFRHMYKEEQEVYIQEIFRLFSEGDLSIIHASQNMDFHPLTADISQNQVACTQLFSTFVCALKKGVSLPVTSKFTFLNEIIEQALRSTYPVQVEAFGRLIGSLVNKEKEDRELNDWILHTKQELENWIGQESTPALTIYLWLTKALVIKSHPMGYEMTDKIISYLADTSLGKQAAAGFDILIGDDALCLNKQTSCTISVSQNCIYFYIFNI
ncbi:Dos2-interacting transcription regulator of RNA-Pol-II-domain-containing protein [Pilobolus umbonatus]|nr:Dos2-interacting transcription regulator of RNA-Pol-II-domain-containing protein [Pilobolus umbonatus]